MRASRDFPLGALLAIGLVGISAGGCGMSPVTGELTTGSIAGAKVVEAPTAADKECLERAMYFESNRTDEQGLLAVGTVVMNRLDAPAYPGKICDVVGQKKQFAAGVLTKPVREADRPRIAKVAALLLAGERHPEVGQALHFHTAGHTFPYNNMHYVASAGGNVFYEKSDRQGYLPAPLPNAVVRVAGGTLVPVKTVALADASLVEPALAQAAGIATETVPATTAAPVQLAAVPATQPEPARTASAAPVLPAKLRTRYASIPGAKTKQAAKAGKSLRDICRIADASLD